MSNIHQYETMWELEILGEPVAKGRPRLGKGGARTPKKTKRAQRSLQWEFINKFGHPEVIPKNVPVFFVATFVLTPPRRIPKSKQLRLAQTKAPAYHGPDVDNMGKLVLDALNGLAWEDDRQVAVAQLEKRYGEDPKTIIKIGRLKSQ